MTVQPEKGVSNEGRSYPEALIHGGKRRMRSPAWLARAASIGLCLASVGFICLFIAPIAMFGQVGLFLDSLPKRIALALPPFIVVFAVGTVIGSGLGWWKQYWSVWARIHQTIVALLGIGFVWQLSTLGLI